MPMDCDGLRWNGSQYIRRFKHPFTLMLPILITRCARSNRTGARAQNGAMRSKRRYVLKTALCVQTVLRVQTRFGRSAD